MGDFHRDIGQAGWQAGGALSKMPHFLCRADHASAATSDQHSQTTLAQLINQRPHISVHTS